jgi:hypothetical protein
VGSVDGGSALYHGVGVLWWAEEAQPRSSLVGCLGVLAFWRFDWRIVAVGSCGIEAQQITAFGSFLEQIPYPL